MILITGGSGFLGKRMTLYCTERYRELKKAKSVNPCKWHFFNYDIPFHSIINPDPWCVTAGNGWGNDNLADLDDKVKDCEYVIHAAAVADLNDSAKNPEKNERINIEGTVNVANACLKHNKLLVFISTCCAYGNEEDGSGHKGIITEMTTPHPTEIYAQSKLRGEELIAQMLGLRYRIARIATLYGPGMRPALFNYVALKHVAEGKEIVVHGDGKQTRTYGYVDDVVSGIFTIAEKGKDGEIYNVAGREHVSVLDSIDIASSMVGTPAIMRKGEDRQGQIKAECISSAKLMELGWEDKVSFRQGMELTYAWMMGGEE